MQLVQFFIFDADAHGCLLFPNQRGALSNKAPYVKNVVPGSKDTVVDFFMHFPAGDKTNQPGSGRRSQQKAARTDTWAPYDPFNRRFRWRSGPCGDLVSRRDHLKGGKYYNGGMISATFQEGGLLNAQVGITAHHNGFMELYLCDVSKCRGGDISPSCFHDGHCRKLERAGNDQCETNGNKRCGPKDPNYPGRWYLPCNKYGRKERYNWVSYGTFGEAAPIRYRLPKGFHCDHCVLQWYWSAANDCNPPGVLQYFQSSRNKPDWGSCTGQGGARGGYTRVQRPCGKNKFPEEYYQCSDIRILRKGSNNGSGGTGTQTRPNPPQEKDDEEDIDDRDGNVGRAKGFGAVQGMAIVRDGIRLNNLGGYDVIRLRRSAISIEAFGGSGVRTLTFEVFDGRRRIVRQVVRGSPFYIFGYRTRRSTKIPNPWLNIPTGKKLKLVVSGTSPNGRIDKDKVFIVFLK